MNARTELAGGTLTVHLPDTLVAGTRGQMVDALSAALEDGRVARVRLDASALAVIDAAGIGALCVQPGSRARSPATCRCWRTAPTRRKPS